ncbi:MAG: aspartyl protease family protein [Sandarakinorhabdus sp.]|nr:aspartyl protease family protein [Sandarakinorhabdus sp.]
MIPPPLIPTATVDNSLEITGDEIDAEQKRNRLFIDVRINDDGPFRFLVDSGADRSVIGAGLAARLRLPAGDAVRVQGMAGVATVATVMIDRLLLGKSEVGPIKAPALLERDLGAQGLIGIDALAEQRLLLDFDAKTITVQDSRTAPVNEAGEIVVTARLRKGQLIITQASVGDQRISAVIDTGAEVTLGNMALRRRLLGTKARAGAPVMTLVSVTGQTLEAEVVMLPRIRIGGVFLDRVMVAFADAPPFALFGLDQQPALFLGSDLLKSFRRVSLDFRNRKVRFALR